jgi:phage-related tail protein
VDRYSAAQLTQALMGDASVSTYLPVASPGGLDGPAAGGRAQVFLSAAMAIQPKEKLAMATTKAQEIYDKVNELVDSGVEKTDAFKRLSQELDRPYDSIRGSFYSHKKRLEGGASKPRTKRRETTPEDALADARAALERSIAAIDREVEAAEERATEAAAEVKALKSSAAERKKAITERLEALR